jgi:NADPH:quinone reductase-like Zn-dependent oxidoreductase
VHAAVLHTPGSPPRYGDLPDPEPQPGRSLVRVTAAPLVPLDLLCATGTSYFGRPAVPYVPGVQGVGEVEQSEHLAPGVRVWFATSAGMAPGDGSLAERCSVGNADVVPIDAGLPDAPLAALGLSAVAAWMALTWRGRLAAGERVLVLGAGGAVGQVAVGAARLLGASSVVAVCRSAAARERARVAGADDVVESCEDVEELMSRLRGVGCHDVDVVVDPVFGGPATAAATLLAAGGRLVNIGAAAGDRAVFSSAGLRSRSAEILGYTNNALTPDQRNDALRTVVGHAAEGRLGVAHEVRALADVERVWTEQRDGETTARVVLTPTAPLPGRRSGGRPG